MGNKIEKTGDSLPATIMVVDDKPANVDILTKMLDIQGYKTRAFTNSKFALESAKSSPPSLILLDIKMPGLDGFMFCRELKKNNATAMVPVIFISALLEAENKINAFEVGGVDYITKPFQESEVIARIKTHLSLFLMKNNLEALVEQRTFQLHNIVNNYKGFIFTCNNQCTITYMNPSLISYIGFEAIGEKCDEVIFKKKSLCTNCKDQKHISDQDVRQEVQVLDDGRWYDAMQSKIIGHDGSVLGYQTILIDITEQKKNIQDLKEREEYFRNENIRLKSSLSERFKFGSIIGKSLPMQEVYENIINASASDAAVIIYGESGTGKELVAKEIHENSPRKNEELVYVNCGAIPENLIESEFFGYKKGAFTGADKDKHGLLDFANKGSLFMDEIGEIPLNMQVKLLRALEQGGYTPIGSSELKKTDIRIIAATNRDLKDLVRKGLMRQDFLYRIHIIPINIPPLRERKDDIPFLIDHFLSGYDGKKVPIITPAIAKTLQNYD
jgi:DNA-binding NtrC family response regulator